jgi:hypothetical protein
MRVVMGGVLVGASVPSQACDTASPQPAPQANPQVSAYAAVSEPQGTAPSRTAASLSGRPARNIRITIVKGIRLRCHLAGHEVAVPADWDLGDKQLTIDQVSSTYDLRRSAASAVERRRKSCSGRVGLRGTPGHR